MHIIDNLQFRLFIKHITYKLADIKISVFLLQANMFDITSRPSSCSRQERLAAEVR